MIPFLKLNKTLILLILLATGLSLFRIGYKSLWIDEIISYQVANHRLTDMFHILYSKEANMWFYYSLLWLWIKVFGSGVFWLRLLSAMPGILSISVIYKFTEENFTKKTALVVALLSTLNVFFVFNSQDVRSYSFMLLFSSLSSLYLFRGLANNKKGDWLLFTLATILNIYTHFYAVLFLVAQSLFVLFDKKIKRLIVPNSIVFITTLPLVLSESFSTKQVDWIPKPVPFDIAATLTILSGDIPPLAIMLTILIGLFVVKKYIATRTIVKILSTKQIYLTLIVGLPILMAFCISYTVKSIYQANYFYFALPYFYILVFEAVSYVFSKKRFLITAVVLALLSLRLVPYYLNLDIWSWTIENKNEEWNNAASYINSNALAGDGLLFFSYFCEDSSHYYHFTNNLGLEIPVINIASAPFVAGGGDSHNQPHPDTATITKLFPKYDRLWLVLCHDKSEGGIDTRDTLETEIKQNIELNYRLFKQTDFYRVKVLLYKEN